MQTISDFRKRYADNATVVSGAGRLAAVVWRFGITLISRCFRFRAAAFCRIPSGQLALALFLLLLFLSQISLALLKSVVWFCQC